MSKLLITILLLSIALPIQASLYNQDGFTLSGNPNEGWLFITPLWDYFGYWLGDILGSMAINKETKVADCWLIENGLEKKCSTQDFSILLFNFPYQLIEDLK